MLTIIPEGHPTRYKSKSHHQPSRYIPAMLVFRNRTKHATQDTIPMPLQYYTTLPTIMAGKSPPHRRLCWRVHHYIRKVSSRMQVKLSILKLLLTIMPRGCTFDAGLAVYILCLCDVPSMIPITIINLV